MKKFKRVDIKIHSAVLFAINTVIALGSFLISWIFSGKYPGPGVTIHPDAVVYISLFILMMISLVFAAYGSKKALRIAELFSWISIGIFFVQLLMTITH